MFRLLGIALWSAKNRYYLGSDYARSYHPCEIQGNISIYIDKEREGGFQVTVEKTIPKLLLWRFMHNTSKQRVEQIAITCNLLKPQEKSRIQGAID